MRTSQMCWRTVGLVGRKFHTNMTKNYKVSLSIVVKLDENDVAYYKDNEGDAIEALINADKVTLSFEETQEPAKADWSGIAGDSEE